MNNILSNAIKYSYDGTNVSITIDRIDGALVCTISNEGIGIPDEELSSIFTNSPFIQKGLSKEVGHGYGLKIVKEIIGLHGGEVNIQSSEGLTTFTFTLPINQD